MSEGANRFDIKRELGEGGMAVVYEGIDTTLRRPVAIKCLKEKYASSDIGRERFFDEAYILAELDNPGFIPVYDLGIDPFGRNFYAMKKISGKTLEELLGERRERDIRDAKNISSFLEYFMKLCETVAYAHKHHIVHRDLKPSNVMVDQFDVLYLMDWGIAKRLNRTEEANTDEHSPDDTEIQRTQMGRVFGSPAFMSPEQAAGLSHCATTETDVFSLGVILYTILTGSRPFQGSSRTELLDQVMKFSPPAPSTQNPVVSRELSAICLKAMEKEPRYRYTSAADLLEDLRNYRSFLPVTAAPPRLGDKISHWGKRNKTLASVLLTLVFVSLFLGGAISWQGYREYQIQNRFEELLQSSRETIDFLEEESHRLGAALHSETDAHAAQKASEQNESLEIRLTVARLEFTRQIAALLGHTIISPDKEVLDEFREQNVKIVQSLLDRQQYETARAFAAQMMESHHKRRLIYYTPEELAVVQQALEISERQAKSN